MKRLTRRDPRRVIIERSGYGPTWRAQKKAALERDNYTCQKCGHVGKRNRRRQWSVSVHHKRKIVNFVDRFSGVIDYEAANDLDNLITLCHVGNKCHQVADGHKKRKGFKGFIR